MLTTFDECYDNKHSYLILGALFCPSHKKIHRDFAKAKRESLDTSGVMGKLEKLNIHYVLTAINTKLPK